MTSLIKQGDKMTADFTGIRRVEVDFEFEQTSGGSKLGALRNRFSPADPDLCVVAYVDRKGIDYVNPKDPNKARILGGAVEHRGDGRGAGLETAFVDLSLISRENEDVNAFAFVVVCAAGFARVPGATARIYDASGSERAWVGNVRTQFTAEHKTAVLGVLHSDGMGWRWDSRPRFGYDTGFNGLAQLGAAEIPNR